MIIDDNGNMWYNVKIWDTNNNLLVGRFFKIYEYPEPTGSFLFTSRIIIEANIDELQFTYKREG